MQNSDEALPLSHLQLFLIAITDTDCSSIYPSILLSVSVKHLFSIVRPAGVHFNRCVSRSVHPSVVSYCKMIQISNNMAYFDYIMHHYAPPPPARVGRHIVFPLASVRLSVHHKIVSALLLDNRFRYSNETSYICKAH